MGSCSSSIEPLAVAVSESLVLAGTGAMLTKGALGMPFTMNVSTAVASSPAESVTLSVRV